MKLFGSYQILVILVFVFPNIKAGGSKLMVFLLDGFRWDYFDQRNITLPSFKRLLSNGIRADYMTVDFPSQSLPNYYTLMTGLHTESHGIIGNDIYDEKTNTYFTLDEIPSWSDPKWWNNAEPLWVSAEKQGKKSYMYYWPGCHVEIRGTSPTYCKPYFYGNSSYIDMLTDSIKDGIEMFKTNSADLVAIYSEIPDAYGHAYGPKSDKLNQKLEEMDEIFGQLLDNLTAEGLHEEVIIMIFSDHGMTELSPERTINLTDFVDNDDLQIDVLSNGPMCGIWPKADKIDKVYNDLKNAQQYLGHFQVFKKNEIPEKWHYRENARVAPVTVVADLGWYILQFQPIPKGFPFYGNGDPMKGHHGYDPTYQDMKGIFVASGPGLKKNVKVKPIHAVDIYQLMSHILEITPALNNGTWSHVADVLAVTSSAQSRVYTHLMVALLTYFSLLFLP